MDVEIHNFNKRKKYLTYSLYQTAQLTHTDNSALIVLGEHSSDNIFSKHTIFTFSGVSSSSAVTTLT